MQLDQTFESTDSPKKHFLHKGKKNLIVLKPLKSHLARSSRCLWSRCNFEARRKAGRSHAAIGLWGCGCWAGIGWWWWWRRQVWRTSRLKLSFLGQGRSWTVDRWFRHTLGEQKLLFISSSFLGDCAVVWGRGGKTLCAQS